MDFLTFLRALLPWGMMQMLSWLFVELVTVLVPAVLSFIL